MHDTNTWPDDNIPQLRGQLQRHRFGSVPPEAYRLQSTIDAKASTLRFVVKQRALVGGELRWALAAANGYEQALVLAGGSPDLDEMPQRGRRFRRRLADERAKVEALTQELAEFDTRIAALGAEVTAAHHELVRLLKGALAGADDQARRQRLERLAAGQAVDASAMWSPTAVLGYRIWTIAANQLCGHWQVWATPHQTATCTADGPLPHTDGRCAEVAFGCGIYAAKSPRPLLAGKDIRRNSSFAVGLVGLEGTVVEHERGYRAERASVLALAVYSQGALWMTDDPADLSELFRSPSTSAELGIMPLPQPKNVDTTRGAISDYLDYHARRKRTWTSANNNG
jgi:hypothetical protein